MRLTLAGNPNSGKTTLYNALTGKMEYVGNWSGVTVDVKEVDVLPHLGQATIVDLPGAYSISPYSTEETVSIEFIKAAKSEAIINIVDITNLERSLFFTTQLLELEVPMVIAMNKWDILQDEIDTDVLAQSLGCPVIPVSAEKGENLEALVVLAKTARKPKKREHLTEDHQRFALVDELLKDVYIHKVDRSKATKLDKLDRILTHQFFGMPLFFAILAFIFSFSQIIVGGTISDFLSHVFFGEMVPTFLNNILSSIQLHPLLQGLIVDGMIGGVGAILSYTPLIMSLFFLLALLEDCGYMARVAVVMDFFFKKIGLSGKAIIPMVVGSGCSIPGVMASRTIENENQRKRMVILAPFVPCGGKLTVIALFSAVFFDQAPWVYPAVYFLSVVIICAVGTALNWVFTEKEQENFFIIELPQYRLPRLDYAYRHMMDKALSFVKRAFTIVLVCNTWVWLLQTYDSSFHAVSPENSMLASIGNFFVPLFIPLGFASWQLVTASLTGFISKENIITTLAVLYFSEMQGAEFMIMEASGNPMLSHLNGVTAFSYLVFNLFIPPCFSAIAAMHGELKNGKWLRSALMVQLSTGYTLALLINQIGTLLTTGATAPAFAESMTVFVLLAVLAVISGKRIQRIHYGV